VHTRGVSPRLRAATEENIRVGEGRELTADDRTELKALARIDALCTDVVTEETGYYFGRIGGRWRLLVLDIVTPCSA
jgi:hypothetical protein